MKDEHVCGFEDVYKHPPSFHSGVAIETGRWQIVNCNKMNCKSEGPYWSLQFPAWEPQAVRWTSDHCFASLQNRFMFFSGNLKNLTIKEKDFIIV